MENLFRSSAPTSEYVPAQPELAPKTIDKTAAYIHPLNISELRSTQQAWIDAETKRRYVADGGMLLFDISASQLPNYQATLSELTPKLYGFNEAFISSHADADDPKLAEYVSLLNTLSINNISESEWYLGPKTDKGYDNTKSGITRAYAEWSKYTAEPVDTDDDVDDLDDDPDEEVARLAALAAAEEERLAREAAEKARLEEERLRLELDAKNAEILKRRGELDLSRKTLEESVSKLAESQALRRFRFIPNFLARKSNLAHRDQLNELSEAKDAALKDYATKVFEAFKADKPDATEDELRQIAAQLTKAHFEMTIKEQTNPNYVHGKWANAARVIGRQSVKKRVAIGVIGGGAALAVTAGAAFIGGVGALAVGLPGLGIVKGISALKNGVYGHGSKTNSDEVMRKVITQDGFVQKRLLNRDPADIFAFEGATSDDLINEIGERSKEATKRINHSDKVRRVGTGALFVASLVPVAGFAAKRIHNAHGAKEAKDAVKDSAKNKTASGKTTATPGGTFDPNHTSNQTIPGANTTPNTVYGPNIPADALKGQYPYDRAVNLFGGEKTPGADAKAIKWLHEMVDKTPGAKWHNVKDAVDTNDWISINGRSDTAYVMEQLLKTYSQS